MKLVRWPDSVSFILATSVGWLGLAPAGLAAIPTTNGVAEAWATRIAGPPFTTTELGGIALGPSGSIFVASSTRDPQGNMDLVLRRHGADGREIWQQRYQPEPGASGNELPTAIAVRGTNVYVAGTAFGTNGGQDFVTLKYRETGEFEWAARFDATGPYFPNAVAVAADAVGNVIVAGHSPGTNGPLDFVVLKYDPSGALLWSYRYDGPAHSADRISAMKLDAFGQPHLARTVVEADGNWSVITIKLDADGRELWSVRERSSRSGGVYANGLDLDAAGNVATAGSGGGYGVVWKYNASGQLQWRARHRAEEEASIQATGVRFDLDGNALLGANLYGAGTNDSVLIKYAPDGQQLWAARVAIPNAVAHHQAFDLDATGNAYLTFTPGLDAVTVKVGADGSQRWSATFNSGDLNYDAGRQLLADAAGNVILATRSSGAAQVWVSLVRYTQQPVPGLPLATIAPSLRIVDPGERVVFTAQATGAGTPRFQWRRNGGEIQGATGATLTIDPAQASDRCDYSVIVSNAAGMTISAEARLTVRIPPVVTLDPADVLAYLGTDAAFVSTVAGNDFAALQWRHNGVNISGATNESLYLENIGIADGGAYDLVVSTLGGTTTSSAAGLRISGELRQIGISSHRSHFSGWNIHPLLHVMPGGETIIAGVTNDPVRGPLVTLRKQDAAGTQLWTTALDLIDCTNAAPSGLGVDATGNIYVAAASFRSFVPSSACVLKYSPDGQRLWSRHYAGTNQSGVYVRGFLVDADGNSTIGTMSGNGNEMTLLRHSSAGDVVWSVRDETNAVATLSLVAAPAGGVYLGTTVRVLEGITQVGEVRLHRLNSAGETLWTRVMSDGFHSHLEGLAADATGSLIAAGIGIVEGVMDSRVFVLKYSPEGTRLWTLRTGDWPDVSHIPAVAVGPDGQVTVLTMSDDDAEPEHSALIGVSSEGQVRYRTREPRIVVSSPSQLALDRFGNAYVTGHGGRPATGNDVVTAKYDPSGNPLWMVHHGAPSREWEYGVSVASDATGDIHVLASGTVREDSSTQLTLLRYRQRDPAGAFRLKLIPDAAGTFHLSTPTVEPYRIEVSTDMRQWSPLTPGETQRVLQPGGGSFSNGLPCFFRLILAE